MTGTTDHQEEKAGLESEVKTGTDQPLGVDKQALKEAADAILDADSGQTADSEDIGDEHADPLMALVNDLKSVHAERAELQNQLLRSAAEMENLRKRTRREIADSREFSIASFARDLLSVTDNLRRAIEAVPAEEVEAGPKAEGSGLKNLLEGVSMTERELHATLEKYKVRKISPKGEKFNPNFHQAMFEVPNTDIPNNTVVEVVQDGYVIGERMLRPAMVGVSKGGPRNAKPKTDAPGENQQTKDVS